MGIFDLKCALVVYPADWKHIRTPGHVASSVASGLCLSDRVVYGTVTIFGIGGVLGIMAFGMWELL